MRFDAMSLINNILEFNVILFFLASPRCETSVSLSTANPMLRQSLQGTVLTHRAKQPVFRVLQGPRMCWDLGA